MTGISATDFDHIKIPEVRRLLEYWIGLSSSNSPPRKSQLDPTEIPWALSRSWLMKFDHECNDFRYLLAGEDVQRIFGKSLIGRRFAEFLDPGLAEFLHAKFKRVIEEPAICHDAGTLYVGIDKPGKGERIVLPFRDDQTDETLILFGFTVYDWDGWTVQKPSDREVKYVTTFSPVATAHPLPV